MKIITTHEIEKTEIRAWHMPAMLGCSTECPNCKHHFTCCPHAAPCCTSRRSVHVSSGGGGGGVVVTTTPLPPSPAQVSPSVPLTFVLPTFLTVSRPPPEPKPETDLAHLEGTLKALRLSGWYYESLTFNKSDELLKNTRVGTFLVRNSSDPRFLFSLSVQTDRGPRSVRLFYINGFFRLDAQPHLQQSMPLFPSVVELVHYYVRRRKKQDPHVWVDPQGKCLSSIYLDRPFRKEPASLKHLARLTINKKLGQATATKLLKLELPNSLTQYLAEYPYLF